MSRPFQVGITGGIGSGKSTVASIFSCLGVPVYDADTSARDLMISDGTLIDNIKQEFGNAAYDSLGHLDKKYLAEMVFDAPDRLQKLNEMVHPRVALHYSRWIDSQSNSYTVKEAALLFESGSYKQLDKIIVVSAPVALRIERVTKRDQRKESEVRHIIARQWPEDKSKEMSDYEIVNDGESAVIPQVLKLHKIFMAFQAQGPKPPHT